MEIQSKNIALIIAGGSGLRMHGELPKQFLEVNGVPVLIQTLLAFEKHPLIDEIAVVCIPEWCGRLQQLGEKYGITKLTHIFKGGDTSQASVCNGVRGLREAGCSPTDVVLVHDGVRPLVTERIISENIKICRKCGNAVTVVKGCESFLYSENGVSSDIYYSRENMYKVQTPHTFLLSSIIEALAEAEHKQLIAQSLYVLMAELGRYPFYFVEGEQCNFKLTYPEDLIFLKIYKGKK